MFKKKTNEKVCPFCKSRNCEIKFNEKGIKLLLCLNCGKTTEIIDTKKKR